MVIYFGICFAPLAFVLFMIGGALEDVRLVGVDLGSLFVISGVLLLGLLLLLVVAAPCVTLVLTQRDAMLVKEIRFVGFPVRKRVFTSTSLHVSNERRGVFASDTLATQETIQLKSVSENGVERTVVGDLGRIFFGVDCFKILEASD